MSESQEMRELRAEVEQLRNKLNETLDQFNKVQRYLQLTDAMWQYMASEPWVRFFMWIRPLTRPRFERETIYPLRINRDRAPTLPPLVEVNQQQYDDKLDPEKAIARRTARKPPRRKRETLAQIAERVTPDVY